MTTCFRSGSQPVAQPYSRLFLLSDLQLSSQPSYKRVVELNSQPVAQPCSKSFSLLRFFLLSFSWLLSIFLFTSRAIAQDTSLTTLTHSIDSLVSKRLSVVSPGAVVLVAKQGKAVYEKAFGFADLSSKTPMDTEAVFRIGSMTKQFTAIAILQLVEAGKISLQDSLQQYVKAYPYKGHTITIEHLLTMSSGIKDYLQIDNPAKERDHYTPAQGVEYFKDEPLKFEPGTGFDYSSSNYYLLGYIIELVTREPYEAYMKEHVLNAAGLTHTFFADESAQGFPVPVGYMRTNKDAFEKAELQPVDIMYAAGALMSNAADLLKWHNALLEGKLISTALLQKAFTAYRFKDGKVSAYGYGWFINKNNTTPTIEHGGSTDGFQTDAVYLASRDIFVVALYNGFKGDMNWTVLTNDIVSLSMGNDINHVVTIPLDSMKRYVGTYVFNKADDHRLVITLKKGRLYVKATNPKDRLPELPLWVESENVFYIKEAPLRFEFLKDSVTGGLKVITHSPQGGGEEWYLQQ